MHAILHLCVEDVCKLTVIVESPEYGCHSASLDGKRIRDGCIDSLGDFDVVVVIVRDVFIDDVFGSHIISKMCVLKRVVRIYDQVFRCCHRECIHHHANIAISVK